MDIQTESVVTVTLILHSWLDNINMTLLISGVRSNIFYHVIRKKDPVILWALTAMDAVREFILEL